MSDVRSEFDCLHKEYQGFVKIYEKLYEDYEGLKGEVGRVIQENADLQSELTKARELLLSTSARLHNVHRNIDRLFELEPKHKVKLLTDALHTVVYAYKCIDNPAHQSAPAAKG